MAAQVAAIAIDFLNKEQIEMIIGCAVVPGAMAFFNSRNSGGGSVWRLFAFAFVLYIATFAGLTRACADIYLMESTAPGMRTGVRLTMDDTISIPAGTYVRAVLPSGKTQTIRGPYTGKVSDLSKGVEQNESLMVPLRKILESGGSMETTTGGTRSVTGNPDKPRGFSLVEIPSWVNGKICLLKAGHVVLTRLSTTLVDRATLVDVASFERAQVVWEAGSPSVAWPASLQLRPDGIYQLLMQDRESREITVRMLDKAPDDNDVLIELHKVGCIHQLEAWVRERMLAGKDKR